MTTLSIRVPDSLHRAIKELATKDGYSMNQFLITAAAEKLSALETVDYLRHRAERANLDLLGERLDLPSARVVIVEPLGGFCEQAAAGRGDLEHAGLDLPAAIRPQAMPVQAGIAEVQADARTSVQLRDARGIDGTVRPALAEAFDG